MLKPDFIPPIKNAEKGAKQAALDSRASSCTNAKPEGYLRGFLFDWVNIKDNILETHANTNPLECQKLCKDKKDCVAWEVCNCGKPGPGCDGCYLIGGKGVNSDKFKLLSAPNENTWSAQKIRKVGGQTEVSDNPGLGFDYINPSLCVPTCKDVPCGDCANGCKGVMCPDGLPGSHNWCYCNGYDTNCIFDKWPQMRTIENDPDVCKFNGNESSIPYVALWGKFKGLTYKYDYRCSIEAAISICNNQPHFCGFEVFPSKLDRIKCPGKKWIEAEKDKCTYCHQPWSICTVDTGNGPCGQKFCHSLTSVMGGNPEQIDTPGKKLQNAKIMHKTDIRFYTCDGSDCGKAVSPDYVELDPSKSSCVYIKMPLPNISTKYLNSIKGTTCAEENECYLLSYAIMSNKQHGICMNHDLEGNDANIESIADAPCLSPALTNNGIYIKKFIQTKCDYAIAGGDYDDDVVCPADKYGGNWTQLIGPNTVGTTLTKSNLLLRSGKLDIPLLDIDSLDIKSKTTYMQKCKGKFNKNLNINESDSCNTIDIEYNNKENECVKDANCPYVNEIEKNPFNIDKCGLIKDPKKCISNPNIPIDGKGGGDFQQCWWNPKTKYCESDWSEAGCNKDIRCCYNANPKPGEVECASKRFAIAKEGFENNDNDNDDSIDDNYNTTKMKWDPVPKEHTCNTCIEDPDYYWCLNNSTCTKKGSRTGPCEVGDNTMNCVKNPTSTVGCNFTSCNKGNAQLISVSVKDQKQNYCPENKPWVNSDDKKQCCSYPWSTIDNKKVCMDKQGDKLPIITLKQDAAEPISCPSDKNLTSPIDSVSYESWSKKTVCCDDNGCVPPTQKLNLVPPGIYPTVSDIQFSTFSYGIYTIQPSMIDLFKKKLTPYEFVYWVLINFPPHSGSSHGLITSVIYPLDTEPTYENILFVKSNNSSSENNNAYQKMKCNECISDKEYYWCLNNSKCTKHGSETGPCEYGDNTQNCVTSPENDEGCTYKSCDKGIDNQNKNNKYENLVDKILRANSPTAASKVNKNNKSLVVTYDLPWYNWLKTDITQVDDKLKQSELYLTQTISIMKYKTNINIQLKQDMIRGDDELLDFQKALATSTMDLAILKNEQLEADVELKRLQSIMVPFEKPNRTPEFKSTLLNTYDTYIKSHVDLLQGMLGIYSNEVASSAQSKSNLINQKTMQGIVDEHIITSQNMNNKNTEIKTAENRLNEITKNYLKEQNLYSQVYVILVYICIPLLILHILQSYNILSKSVAYSLFLVIFFIGLYYFMRKVHDISNRNNMNVDAINNSVTDAYSSSSSSSDNILDYDKKQFVRFKDFVVSGADYAYNMSKNKYESEKDSVTKEYNKEYDAYKNKNKNKNADNNSGSGSAGPIALPTASSGPQ